jgi:serine phosphatase RsbU (regulator of sigma subunit)
VLYSDALIEPNAYNKKIFTLDLLMHCLTAQKEKNALRNILDIIKTADHHFDDDVTIVTLEPSMLRLVGV